MPRDAIRRAILLRTLCAALFGSTLALLAGAAEAQAWPARQVRVLVGFPPGGLTDLYARAYGEYIGQRIGQPVVIENRAGAGGIIANDVLAKAPPDGYTLGFTIQGTLVQAQALYKKLPYDPNTSFTFISAFNPGHLPFAVHRAVPATTFREFVDWARNNPVNMGSFAPGSSAHMIAAQLNKLYGTRIEPIHYKGEGLMWPELSAGRIHAAVGSFAGASPHLQSGTVRVLAVPTLARSPKLPEVPTYVEQGFDAPIFKLRGWIGFIGPAGLPREIVEQVSKLVLEAADSARVRQLHETFGILEKPTTPQEFERLFREEGPVWIAIAKELGVTLD